MATPKKLSKPEKVIGNQPFAEALIKDIRAKFKRPTVVRALLGLADTTSNNSHVGGVIRGERALPPAWVARFAEITDRDPIDAVTRYKAERAMRPNGITANHLIREALDAYPIHRSNHIPGNAKQQQLAGLE